MKETKITQEDTLYEWLHVIILELLNQDGCSPGEAASQLCEERPELLAAFGESHIRVAAERMFRDEIPILSKAYTGLYKDFNKRYFEGRLETYDVKVGYFIIGKKNCDRHPADVAIDPALKRIWLRISLPQERMVDTLLTKMAEVATNKNEEKFRLEMWRLRKIGAPVHSEVGCRELRGVHMVSPTQAQCAHAFRVLRRAIKSGSAELKSALQRDIRIVWDDIE